MNATIELINSAEKRLAEAAVASPRLDAEVLLAHAMGVARMDLYMKDDLAASRAAYDSFADAIERRAAGCPVAYITGVKEFWSIPITITPDVLIPRPETELVVERALEILKPRAASRELNTDLKLEACDILDLCTGSGCVAAALATELPSARFVLTDISPEAIDVARNNLEFASGRTEFFIGDLFAPVEGRVFDIITANPPYIPTGHRPMLCREITEHEPEIALYGGKSGLDFIARIIENAAAFLKPGGWLISEMGLGQADKLAAIAGEFTGYGEPVISKDLAGIERVISFRKIRGR